MPKKTLPKAKRLTKGRQWVSRYEGQHLVKGYRQHFGVDRMTAIRDLHEIGVIGQDQFDLLVKHETERIALVQRQREEKRAAEWEKQHKHQNDQFYFIVGYTPGGAPYGVTWEEMGLTPWEEIE